MPDIEKLHRLLAAAKLPVAGVSENGRVDYTRALDSTEQAAAAQILAAKNDPDSQARRLAAFEMAGITIAELVIALWEQVVEGKPEAAQELQTRLLAVIETPPKAD